MREILFRGKHNGEWVYGSFASAPQKALIYEISESIPTRMEGKFVDIKTVGQFTGLYDKNGNRIFEGDIIICYTLSRVHDYRTSVVRWSEIFLCFKEDRSLLYGGYVGDIYEVIGNIHDNPELLEETE